MLLIYPPLGDCTIPPLGIAKLSGFMRNQNQEISVLDYNIDSLYYLLSKDFLHKSYLKICKRLNEIEDQYDTLSKNIQNEYSLLFASKLQAEYLENNIDEALLCLKQNATYENWNIYSKKATVIKQSMELVANAHYPAKWDFRYLTFKDDTCPQAIHHLLQDREKNFYLEYFQTKLQEIGRDNSVYIGISVCYYSQLIPALTLAKLIKTSFPERKIFLGGSLFSSYVNDWNLFDEFVDIIDLIIPFDGEWALYDLATRKNVSDIPDIVYVKNKHFVKNSVIENRGRSTIIPDFSDFKLEKYLNPYILLPIEANTACYWGKCNFCYYSTKDNQYTFVNKKDIKTIVDEMEYMNKMYSATHFFFIDECLPPNTAFNLAKELLHRGLNIKWASEIRFDSAFSEEKLKLLRESGYIMAMLGLESSQDRVLKAMNKGTDPNVISKMLENCAKQHIHTYAMFFLGFPSETKEEALNTIAFIDSHIKYINYYSFGPFILTKNIDVFQNPKKYGITIQNSTTDNLSLAIHYKVNSGLSEHEASALVETLKKERDEFLKYELVSVIHIMYLPKINSECPRTISKNTVTINDTTYKYIKNPDIITQRSRFNILTPNSLKSNYAYLYNCSTQDIFLVSDRFIELYTTILGTMSLSEIYYNILHENKQLLQIMLENELLIQVSTEEPKCY
ncbi:MAG: radical SAM protein [Lachnospiraceae bacterium]|nr:radical SAM protein [Lachnospiraceae bacterium]